MLIRSQNKKELHNLDKISMIESAPVYGKDEEGFLVIINHVKTIGVYSTEEKAIKVLDMMQADYEMSCYSDHAYDSAAQVQRPYLFVRNAVFQMPQDSEVKDCYYEKESRG